MNIFLILHDIRSAHNVGSIFRTADGAGVEKLFLCGYTPSPIDRFGRAVKEIEKTSLGATEAVAWEHRDDTLACVEELKAQGIMVVAIEQRPRAVPYTEARYGERVAFVLGNEVGGVPESVCAAADLVVHIPMHGRKESLNVSVAAGIICFAAREYRE